MFENVLNIVFFRFFQDGMTEQIQGPGLILAALFCLVPQFGMAVPAPASPPALSSPASVSTAAAGAKIEKRDFLLMTLSIRDHLIIARMAPDGACRHYLRQGGGFSAVLPTANKGSDFSVTASPDGKMLAFFSTRSGATNLWVSDSDGLNQRSLTDSDTPIGEFRPLDEPPIQFSPDSRRIAYLQSGNLWICDLSGQNPGALTHEGGISAFAWQPAGKPEPGSKKESGGRLVYLRYGSIYLIGASGLPDELLANDATNYPTLSFNSNASSPELFFFYNGVWKINLQTKKRERLAGSFCFPNRVRSSPAGDSVAFISYSSDVREEVFTLTPGKKGVTTQITLGGASQPIFSRDGKWIYFSRQQGLWRIGLQNEKATQIYDASVFSVLPAELELSVPGACP